MEFEVEWGNPIFYLNFGGLVLSILGWVWSRKAAMAGGWVAMFVILTLGTAIHFIGDLTGLSEDTDHVIIHAVILIALIPAIVQLPKEK